MSNATFVPKVAKSERFERLPDGSVQKVTDYGKGAERRVNVFAGDHPDAKPAPAAKKKEDS